MTAKLFWGIALLAIGVFGYVATGWAGAQCGSMKFQAIQLVDAEVREACLKVVFGSWFSSVLVVVGGVLSLAGIFMKEPISNSEHHIRVER